MTLARRVDVLIAVALAICAAGPTVTYHGTGTVLALLPPPSDLHATRPVIVIEHDPIAGLMAERMAMPFIAASTTLFDGLHAGDRISFGLEDTPGALLVVTIERTPLRRRRRPYANRAPSDSPEVLRRRVRPAAVRQRAVRRRGRPLRLGLPDDVVRCGPALSPSGPHPRRPGSRDEAARCRHGHGSRGSIRPSRARPAGRRRRG